MKKILLSILRGLREARIYVVYLTKAFKRPLVFWVACDSESGWGSQLRAELPVKHWRQQGLNALFITSKLSNNQRKRLNRLLRPDIVLHQTFMNDCADPSHYPQAVNIVDFDDAHFLDDRLQETIIRKCKECEGAIGGSRYTEAWLKQYVSRTARIWTGTPCAFQETSASSSRSEKVVCWATTAPMLDIPEAEYVRDIISICAAKSSFEFLVIGDTDLGALEQFFSPLVGDSVRISHLPKLPYHKFISALERATVGLAPLYIDGECFNSGKSFGKVLAYISAGVPVVATNAVDHELFFNNGVNGFIADDVSGMAEYILTLLDNPTLRDDITRTAKRDLQQQLSLQAFSVRALDFVMDVYNKSSDKTGKACHTAH